MSLLTSRENEVADARRHLTPSRFLAIMRTVIESYAPFGRVEIDLSPSIRASSLAYILEPLCPVDEQALSLFDGRRIPQDSTTTLADLANNNFVHLRLAVQVRGGKGGFGTQVRPKLNAMLTHAAPHGQGDRTKLGQSRLVSNARWTSSLIRQGSSTYCCGHRGGTCQSGDEEAGAAGQAESAQSRDQSARSVA